jgi:hypothetical protein
VFFNEAFTAAAPIGFTLVERKHGSSYATHEVRKGAIPYVGIYVGNAPAFPTGSDARLLTSVASPASATIKHLDGGLSREFLLPGKMGRRPIAIHVWAFEVPGDQEEANKIAASVKASQ